LSVPCGAQAWVPAAHTGSVLLAYQNTDVNKHLFGGDMTAYGGTADGALDMGQVRAQTIQFGYDYGLTSHLAFNGTVAYIGSTYEGAFPEDAMDDATFNGTFQDASFGLRYMVPWKGFAITPLVSYTFPTHSYPTHGHTAVGKGNNSFNAGSHWAARSIRSRRTCGSRRATSTSSFRTSKSGGSTSTSTRAAAGWFPRARLILRRLLLVPRHE
jgi:hypothetical protein